VKVKLLAVMLTILSLVSIACGNSGQDTSTLSTPTTTLATATTNPADHWLADGTINDEEYSNDMNYGNYFIYWWSDDQHVYVGIRAKTLGWVALGIQPGSRMKDADMIIGFVENGNVTVLDLFSTGDFGPHPEDTELGGTNNIIEYGGSEIDGFTTIEFKRALNTADEYDNPLIIGSNKIIWSFGSNDEIESRHSTRDYGEIIL
jgi:hypothetical protein